MPLQKWKKGCLEVDKNALLLSRTMPSEGLKSFNPYCKLADNLQEMKIYFVEKKNKNKKKNIKKILCRKLSINIQIQQVKETLSWINLYHYMGLFSRWSTGDIFFYYPRKQALTFHANCLHWWQFAWNAKAYSGGKIRKIFQNVVCCHF